MHRQDIPFSKLCIALLLQLLVACSNTANSQPVNRTDVVTPVPTEICPPVEPAVCEPEPDLATEAAMRKLQLGNNWHREGRYKAAMEAYEAVLVEHASLLADSYALWGIIALRLDRDNPEYDRDAARTVSYVLDQRVRDAAEGEAAGEARLLWFSAEVMLEADISKDNVVAENRHLRKELAQREEAIQKLRELTVGR